VQEDEEFKPTWRKGYVDKGPETELNIVEEDIEDHPFKSPEIINKLKTLRDVAKKNVEKQVVKK